MTYYRCKNCGNYWEGIDDKHCPECKSENIVVRKVGVYSNEGR